MKEDFICTWIYLDSEEERSNYPQVGSQSHLFSFQKTYWKCVAVFFALSKKFNPGRRHILFTNKPENQFPDVEGFDLRASLKENDVQIVSMPMTWQTPNGYYHTWRNQFFVFDIFTWLEQNCASSDPAFLLLDSDCMINRPLDDLFADLRKHGLLTLPMPFPEDYDISGITRKDMRQIYTELDGGKDPGFNPTYYGGEFFAANLENLKKVNRLWPPLWDALIERFRQGKKKFHYEGPSLSYLYYRIGNFKEAGAYIKRIWTSPKFSNVEPADVNLPIWHLPSEKTGGIALLFDLMKKGKIPFDNLGDYLAVPKRRKYLNFKHFLKHTRFYQNFFKG